jgi:hypothetical protein
VGDVGTVCAVGICAGVEVDSMAGVGVAGGAVLISMAVSSAKQSLENASSYRDLEIASLNSPH